MVTWFSKAIVTNSLNMKFFLRSLILNLSGRIVGAKEGFCKTSFAAVRFLFAKKPRRAETGAVRESAPGGETGAVRGSGEARGL